eukprot:NODE_72_length_24857_cov_0.454399.p16 type:complete len:181 gc:universal NODE_72_length_24857_cov_0.454399:11716-12258(+)
MFFHLLMLSKSINITHLTTNELKWFKHNKNMRLWIISSLKMTASIYEMELLNRRQMKAHDINEFQHGNTTYNQLINDHVKWIKTYDVILRHQMDLKGMEIEINAFQLKWYVDLMKTWVMDDVFIDELEWKRYLMKSFIMDIRLNGFIDDIVGMLGELGNAMQDHDVICCFNDIEKSPFLK